jgi:hypothetical protein
MGDAPMSGRIITVLPFTQPELHVCTRNASSQVTAGLKKRPCACKARKKGVRGNRRARWRYNSYLACRTSQPRGSRRGVQLVLSPLDFVASIQ